jgi:hypothetical protein
MLPVGIDDRGPIRRTTETRGQAAFGQAPSDYPDFAPFLVTNGIDSISLNPDSLLKTIVAIVQAEKASGFGATGGHHDTSDSAAADGAPDTAGCRGKTCVGSGADRA